MKRETITLKIEKSQRDFFLKLIAQFDFAEVIQPKTLIAQYQERAPSDVPITDEEILAEINAIREEMN